MSDWWPYVALLPALWLLLGYPWMEDRLKRRHERERAAWRRELDIAMIVALRGSQGLYGVLADDLRHLMIRKALFDEHADMDEILALLASTRAGR